MPATLTPRDLLTRQEAAAYLGLAKQTLAVWASTGRHAMPFIKLGRTVRYRKSDLEAYLAARTVTHVGESDQ